MLTRRANYAAVAALTIAFLNIVWADQSGTATLTANCFLNLDTGATPGSAGDVLWSGNALMPQGAAGLYNLGKYGSRIFKSIRVRSASSVGYSPTPIPASALVEGDVFGVHTRTGRYAKVIVTAVNGDSLSLRFTTFSATGLAARSVSLAAGSAPAITAIQNNYSWILAGQPNYGIAPGSIFTILGAGLSVSAPPVLQSSAPPGLPKALNQTSVSVTVNGVATTPGLYYTTDTAIAAVLPSGTPVGQGTVTVTYNGQPSAPAPIRVVASAVGLDTLYGTGNGLAVTTDVNGNSFGLTNSAIPGQTMVLWGSGIGADPANDDLTYPQKTDNLTNIPVQVFIGGISATIEYQGRSQYPGLDQYDVVVPLNVTPGCFVSVVALIGTVVSNAVTAPVNPGGGTCSDPATGLTGTEIQALADKSGGTVNAMLALLSVQPGGANSQAFALAGELPSAFFGAGYEYVSEGSCTVAPPEQGKFAVNAPLDAGTIQLSGPNGDVSLGAGPGKYQANLNAPPGTYTFSSPGGANVGAFETALNVPALFTVTNQAALASITRSEGTTVTWSGAFPNGAVQVTGSAGAPAVKFFCYAPSSAGQLTVPPSILLAMPPGDGSINVANAFGQSLAASGLDLGLAIAGTVTKVHTTYK